MVAHQKFHVRQLVHAQVGDLGAGIELQLRRHVIPWPDLEQHVPPFLDAIVVVLRCPVVVLLWSYSQTVMPHHRVYPQKCEIARGFNTSSLSPDHSGDTVNALQPPTPC